MFIEIYHNGNGDITEFWCSNHIPANYIKLHLMERKPKINEDKCKIYLDTIQMLEIEANCGQKAIINPDTGQPEIIKITYFDYISKNYKVDMTEEVAISPDLIPDGMKMRKLLKK